MKKLPLAAMLSAVSVMALSACEGAMSINTVDAAVSTNYAGNYNAYLRDNWDEIYINGTYWSNLTLLQQLAQRGADLDPDWVSRNQRLIPGSANEWYMYHMDADLQVFRWLLANPNIDVRDATILNEAIAKNEPVIFEAFLPYANWRADQCAGEPYCQEALLNIDNLTAQLSDPTNPTQAKMRQSLISFIQSPANTMKLVEMGVDGPTAIAALQNPTGPSVYAQNQTSTSSSGTSDSGRATMGLIGSLGGSLFGGLIGGSDGELMGNTFSGIMNSVANADSEAEVMTGTFTSILGGAGIMDAGTAESVNLLGSLIGSTEEPAVSNSGNVTRTAATTTSVQVSNPTPQATATAASTGISTGGGGVGPGFDYQFSCPGPYGSGPHNISVPASQIPGCQDAMKTFAYTASCNLIDDMEEAQRNYYAICAAEIYQ